MTRWGLVAFVLLLAGLATEPAFAGTATPLSLTSFGSTAVDDANEHVFVSGGQFGNSIVVLDFDGNVITTISGQQGANGMAIDASTGTLYVALQTANAISKIDTGTLTETSRFATTGMSGPRKLALAGGRVWFDYNCGGPGGIGSAALDGTDLTTEGGPECVTFATSPGDTALLAAAVTSSSLASGLSAMSRISLPRRTLPASTRSFSPTPRLRREARRLHEIPARDIPDVGRFAADATPTATGVSLALSKSKVRYGGSLTLSAHLSGATGAVSFYRKPVGGTKTLIASLLVNGLGNASLTVKPYGKTTYTAAFAGDDMAAPSTSAGKTVTVEPRVTVALRNFYATSGKYKLYHYPHDPLVAGAVAPNHAGMSVTFVAERYTGGAWVFGTKRKVVISSNGKALAYLRNTVREAYRVRIVFPGDSDHLASKSPWAYLRVT